MQIYTGICISWLARYQLQQPSTRIRSLNAYCLKRVQEKPLCCAFTVKLTDRGNETQCKQLPVILCGQVYDRWKSIRLVCHYGWLFFSFVAWRRSQCI